MPEEFLESEGSQLDHLAQPAELEHPEVNGASTSKRAQVPFAARLLGNLEQFVKFGMVGGSGTLVNLAVIYVGTKILENVYHLHENDIVWPIVGTDFNVRWFNVIMCIAFLVANTWNYQLNRMWTFKSVSKVSWLRGFFPFLFTGIGALVVSNFVAVLLMNPTSPIGLPESIFDDSSGLRRKFYWASAISILAAMPINFVFNKLWTFRSQPKGLKVVDEVRP